MKILVYIESHDGGLRKSALEQISYAASLKKLTNGVVTAFTHKGTGQEVLGCMARYGAEKVIISGRDDIPFSDFNARAEEIRAVAESEGADLLLFTGSVSGRALAPLVSAKLKAGMVPGIFEMPRSIDPFTISKKVFSGKVVATVGIKTARKVLVLLPNTFPPKESPVPLITSTFNTNISGNQSPGIPGIRIIDSVKTTEQAKLTEAEIVVSGGRGLTKKENWKYVEELAGLLGGATACSRPAWDDGICPHDGYIGQTGKVISPNVYVALGISGAVQHLAGISSSKLMVAVNKDPDAPIFKSADYGIVGDVQEVMPRLIEALKRYRPEGAK